MVEIYYFEHIGKCTLFVWFDAFLLRIESCTIGVEEQLRCSRLKAVIYGLLSVLGPL